MKDVRSGSLQNRSPTNCRRGYLVGSSDESINAGRVSCQRPVVGDDIASMGKAVDSQKGASKLEAWVLVWRF